MRPIALQLNVLVAAIATFKFHRAGHFRWRLFWPFAPHPSGSLPGGAITLRRRLQGPRRCGALVRGWQLWWTPRRRRLNCAGAQCGAPLAMAIGRRAGGALRADRRRRRDFPEPDPCCSPDGPGQADSAVAAPFILVNSSPRSPRVLQGIPPLRRLCMILMASCSRAGWAGAELRPAGASPIPLSAACVRCLAIAGRQDGSWCRFLRRHDPIPAAEEAHEQLFRSRT